MGAKKKAAAEKASVPVMLRSPRWFVDILDACIEQSDHGEHSRASMLRHAMLHYAAGKYGPKRLPAKLRARLRRYAPIQRGD